MQNNLRNRSVALASTFALALTGIVATAPAASAVSPVVLEPSAGTNTGAFITDTFTMDASVPLPYSATGLVFKIDNPKKEIVQFDFSNVGTNISEVTLRATTATGTAVTIDNDDLQGAAISAASNRGMEISLGTLDQLVFDFSDSDVTSLSIYDLEANGGANIDDRAVSLGLTLKKTKTGAFTHGDGNQGDISVQAWTEVQATSDIRTVDSTTASDVATVKWYDPKGVAVIPSIERFLEDTGSGNTSLNYNSITTDADRQGLAGFLSFVRPDLNLEQVDGADWGLDVYRGTTRQTQNSIDTIRVNLAGTGSTPNDDVAGAVPFQVSAVADRLVVGEQSYVEVFHTGDTAKKFRSVAFAPTAGPSAERTLLVTVSDTANTDADAAAPGGTNAAGTPQASGLVDRTFNARPDTETLTYTARMYDAASTARVKEASQPIMAVVTANGFAPEGTTYTVSGSSDTISAAGQAIVVTGLTNSDGDYSVTVSASNPAAATGYDIEFYSLSTDGEWSNGLVGTGGGVTSGDVDRALTVLYATPTVSSPTVVESTLSGETVTAAVTVKDNYGQATNVDGNDALYVTFQSSDAVSLDETVSVSADGAASVSFDNYVTGGASDLITVSLHTGATFSTTNLVGSAQVISLFSAEPAGGLNVPAELTGNVTYDDFITGTASATNVAPNDNTIELTGTVVDDNGAGVPGAQVTIDADGMQLRKKDVGDYAIDSITFSASAAGTFTVQMWSHVLSPTGVDVTISSGGLTETTTVKTYLPTGLSGGNLMFSIDAPANIDVNKTYAIQASLTDKWGNPVNTSGDSVDIVGTGSVEINSKAAGAEAKSFRKDGKVTVFVRSIKDIEGPGTITASLQTAGEYATSATATDNVDRTEVTTDVAGTAHDETSFSNEITVDINVGEAAQSSTQKVNAGSFKGYVAVYAKGYEGQRLSAKIGNDWVIVDPIVNNEGANLHRTTDFTGAGVDIAVRIYIDRVLVDTINLTTK